MSLYIFIIATQVDGNFVNGEDGRGGGGGQGAARADQRYCSPHKQSALKLGDTQ